MQDEELLKLLSSSIISFDVNGVKISGDIITIKPFVYNKRYNKTSLKVYCDNKNVPIRGTKVTYKCSCGEVNTILLKKFLGKTRIKCHACREDEEKRKNHSLFFKEHKQKRITPPKDDIEYSFDDESELFIKSYYSSHLNTSEFYKLLPSIVSINGIKTDNKVVTYFEHEKVCNQFKYRPEVEINGEKINFTNVMLKCEKCGKVFKISDSRSKKEKLLKNKILCRECSFCNHTIRY